jgi:hypothetical protein
MKILNTGDDANRNTAETDDTGRNARMIHGARARLSLVGADHQEHAHSFA